MADRKSCDACTKTFARSSGLSHHKQTHSGGKRYNCSQCNKSFSRDGSLKTHFLIHTGEKPHKCNQCNFSANQAPHLRTHIMKHTGEKPRKCKQCDYTSTHSTNLKNHKRTHSGGKPHRCTMCFQNTNDFSPSFPLLVAGTMRQIDVIEVPVLFGKHSLAPLLVGVLHKAHAEFLELWILDPPGLGGEQDEDVVKKVWRSKGKG